MPEARVTSAKDTEAAAPGLAALEGAGRAGRACPGAAPVNRKSAAAIAVAVTPEGRNRLARLTEVGPWPCLPFPAGLSSVPQSVAIPAGPGLSCPASAGREPVGSVGWDRRASARYSAAVRSRRLPCRRQAAMPFPDHRPGLHCRDQVRWPASGEVELPSLRRFRADNVRAGREAEDCRESGQVLSGIRRW